MRFLISTLFVVLCVAQLNGAAFAASVSCEQCSQPVAFLLQMRESGVALNKIRDSFASSVSAIPNPMMRSFFSKMTEKLDTLETHIRAGRRPDEICRMMTNCAAKPELSSVENEVVCLGCQVAWRQVLEYLDTANLKNQTENEIINQVCPAIEKELPECKSLVKSYIEMAFKLLNSYTPKEFCTLIKLCSASSRTLNRHSKHQQQQQQHGGIVCKGCQVGLDFLETYLNKNATETEVIDSLKQACGLLPPSIKSICLDYASKYGPTLYKLLISELKSGQLCVTIGLCPKKKTNSSSSPSFHRAHKQINMMRTVYAARMTPAKPIRKTAANSVECTLCKLVVSKVESLIESNRSEEAIINAMSKVCSLFPSEIAQPCQSFVLKNFKQLLNLLISEVKPEKVCQLIKACDTQTHVNMIKMTQARPIKTLKSIECVICKLVLTELERLIQANRSEKVIIDGLNKVCSILPSKYKTECDNFVTKYFKTILDLLIRAIKPSEVCSLIQVCASQKPLVVPMTKISSKKCFECQKFIKFTRVAMNLFEKDPKQLEKMVVKLCTLHYGKAECSNILKKFGFATLFRLAKSKLSDEQICQNLLHCKPNIKLVSEFRPEHWRRPSHSLKSKDGLKCEACKEVFTLAYSYLLKPELYEKYLLEACSYVPSVDRGYCNAFVQKHFPEFIAYIKKNYTPTDLCQLIRVCGRSNSAKLEIGGDKNERVQQLIRALLTNRIAQFTQQIDARGQL